MNYLRLVLVIGAILGAELGWGQDSMVVGDSIGRIPFVTPAQDTLLKYLLDNKSGLSTAVELFSWQGLTLSAAGFVFFVMVGWNFWLKDWLKKYVQEKAEAKLQELTSLKKANILVLTSQTGNDSFLRDFFKEKKFPNVRFEQIGDTFKSINDFDYEVVFVNNDDNMIDKSVVREYAKGEQLLFYFGKPTSWDFQNDTPELSRKINFANSRAQIYGNLMSSLEFLELIKPRITNV